MRPDPKAKSLLDMAYRSGAPRFHELDLNGARRAMEKLQYAFQPDSPAVASVVDVPITRRQRGEGVLLARAYRPLSSLPAESLPVLIYLHGGGWCVGSIETHDVLCRQLANRSAAVVLSVGYRLAPEHPFPCAVEDAALAYRWALAEAALIGGDPARICIGGDSAGGNLALVTCLWARDSGLPAPRLQCLVYPSVDIYGDRPSRDEFGDGFLLDRGTLEWFCERYLRHPGDALDWRASPLLAEHHRDLPPVCLVTAGCDPLVDECIALAETLRDSAVPVEHHHFGGMIHGFLTLGRQFPQADQAIDQIAGAIRNACSVSHRE